MPRRKCPPEENILRAILTAHRDERNSRLSSTLFKGRNTSVSRLAILGIRELFAVFHRDLDSPPKSLVVGGGEINIGRLQEIGQGFQPNPAALTVEEAPIETNPAHAEIPENVSRGLALEIIRSLTIHRDPTSP